MLSLAVHYMNKYPKGSVDYNDDRLDVKDAQGRHCVALRKDGAGGLADWSEKLGCAHKHDLSPIPKDARLYKVKDGKIAFDEKAEERKKLLEQFMEDGRVLSCEDLSSKGLKFDQKQELLK